MSGVPFGVLEKLATTATARAARDLLVRQAEFAKAKSEVENLLRSRGHGLSEELFRAWRKAIRSGAIPPAADPPSRAFAACWESANNLATAESSLDQVVERELGAARAELFKSARAILPPYLVFGGEGFSDRLPALLAERIGEGEASPTRNTRARERDRLLLLYLQRMCAKNDTFSAFGPTGWGTIEPGGDALRMAPASGVAKREVFLERWTAHNVATALNADPEVRAELSPRINPNGRIEGNKFFFTDSGEIVALQPIELEILARCDGATPAHSLGVESALLEQLAERKIIWWAVEVPALDAHAFVVLVDEISGWRETSVRARWLDLLRPIAALPQKFAVAEATASRVEIMHEARERLREIGATREFSKRSLYAANNPIAEECFRECGFQISENMTGEFAHDAEPWIDLWRDTYAFVASRVAGGLRKFFETAPVQNGSVPLAAFLRHCETLKMPLTGHGMVALAHMAFQEVKGAFREMMSAYPDAAELQLSSDDCHFVRQNFQYEKFDEYTFPSADLQISAASSAAVEQGNYEWIVSELHPPIAMLHHCFYWSCPDKPALSAVLANTTCGRPSFHYGFFAADFTSHTTVRQMEALPDCTHFLAPQRASRAWNAIPPSEAEVYLDAQNDVCVRSRGSKEHLGSFARSWVIPLGFHPFHFGRSPHMPRLRCGRVIVQRASWTVTREELARGNYNGVSRDLIVAVERLRAEKQWPRYIYIRPSEQALRRSGAEGRDKDTKPVFIDLESYLFLEIFYRWLTKSGELEVTEMLPDPDHLLWVEEDDRRTFELRTLIVPRT